MGAQLHRAVERRFSWRGGDRRIAEMLWRTEPCRHRYRMVAGAVEVDLGVSEIHDGTTVSILVGTAAVDIRGETHRRIFIERRGSPLWRMIDEDELIAALPDFLPVLLETHSVVEQIRLFRNADIIVAPHGAGLTNIGFSRPAPWLAS